jgi:hypothetical protein
MAKITINGTIWNTVNILADENIVQANPAKIFNKQWPDIMLANNRRDKLTTRKLYETTSIKTRRGAIIRGAPGGRNKENKCKPWVLTPIIFIPINIVKAKPKVTIIWLVTVKP